MREVAKGCTKINSYFSPVPQRDVEVNKPVFSIQQDSHLVLPRKSYQLFWYSYSCLDWGLVELQVGGSYDVFWETMGHEVDEFNLDGLADTAAGMAVTAHEANGDTNRLEHLSAELCDNPITATPMEAPGEVLTGNQWLDATDDEYHGKEPPAVGIIMKNLIKDAKCQRTWMCCGHLYMYRSADKSPYI